MVYCAVCYTKSTDRIKIHLNQWQDHPFEASLVDETNGVYKSKLRTGIDALIELMEILEVNGWTLVSTNKEDTYIFRKVFETIVDDTPEVVIEKTSKFRGVTHDLQSTNPWCAKIVYQDQTYFLGTYSTEEAAARAYDEASIQYYGKNAKVNFSVKKNT